MKARILLRQLELPYERVTVDLFKGETRSPEHFGRNPDGRIPVLELDSGETIAESGAILLHLAEGTPYLPADGLARTRVHQWMFFEQDRVEAELGYARFLRLSGRHEQLAGCTRTASSAGAMPSARWSARSQTAASSSPATPTRSPTSPSTHTCIARAMPART
jgi:glutathione S-transferase